MVGNIYKTNFNADAVAIKYKGQTFTYGELDANVQKYSSYLINMGIKKGDKVILSCLNSPEFIFSYLGIVNIGAIVVPINILLTFDEISYIRYNSDAKTVLMHPAAFAKNKLTKEFLEDQLKVKVVVLDDAFKNEIDSTATAYFTKETDENTISTFLYTSGTTGSPKAAMLSHKNLVSNAMQFTQASKINSNDNVMCVLPMFHVFGFTVCILVPLFNGATITILETFQPKEVIRSLVEDGVTVFSGVPAMYVVLLEALKSDIAFPNLRLAISGGASLPVEIFRRAKEELSFPVIEGYGLTEASPVVAFNPIDGVHKAGSIGVSVYGVECKIVDEDGNEVTDGEIGELIVKGDNVMQGYYKMEEESKKALRGGWLYTGDLAKKDEDGYIFIVDRKKDLIIVCGLNVYPREVEEVLYKYPKVKEAAVVGIDDGLRGEYVKAVVSLKEGMECTSKELLRYLKEHLAIYKIPRQIDFIDELPKNSSGKILKRELKD